MELMMFLLLVLLVDLAALNVWEVPPTVTNLTLVDSSPDLFS